MQGSLLSPGCCSPSVGDLMPNVSDAAAIEDFIESIMNFGDEPLAQAEAPAQELSSTVVLAVPLSADAAVSGLPVAHATMSSSSTVRLSPHNGGACRHVTFSELQAKGLVSKFGPPPHESIIAAANNIAERKILGEKYHVRKIARAHACYGGGDRQRIVKYADLIQQLLEMEKRMQAEFQSVVASLAMGDASGLPSSATFGRPPFPAPSSMPPSPPATPLANSLGRARSRAATMACLVAAARGYLLHGTRSAWLFLNLSSAFVFIVCVLSSADVSTVASAKTIQEATPSPAAATFNETGAGSYGAGGFGAGGFGAGGFGAGGLAGGNEALSLGATLLVGGLMALPVLRWLSLDGLSVAPLSSQKSNVLVRWLTPCVASILFWGGIAPFFYEYTWGGWAMMGLGPWVNYAALVPVGGFLLCETVSARAIRWMGAFFASFHTGICVTCVAFAVNKLLEPQRVDIFGMMHACLFLGHAASNGWGAYKVWPQVVCSASNPQEIYSTMHSESRLVLSASGQLIVIATWAMVWWDADVALKHPYSLGVAITAISWLVYGSCLFRSRENLARFPNILSAKSRGATDPAYV